MLAAIGFRVSSTIAFARGSAYTHIAFIGTAIYLPSEFLECCVTFKHIHCLEIQKCTVRKAMPFIDLTGNSLIFKLEYYMSRDTHTVDAVESGVHFCPNLNMVRNNWRVHNALGLKTRAAHIFGHYSGGRLQLVFRELLRGRYCLLGNLLCCWQQVALCDGLCRRDRLQTHTTAGNDFYLVHMFFLVNLSHFKQFYAANDLQ